MELRRCTKCTLLKPRSAFHKNWAKRGIKQTCKICANTQNRSYYHTHKPEIRASQRKYAHKECERARVDPALHSRLLWEAARTRAKKLGIAFTITPGDIPVPKVCPVLGVLLKRNRKTMNEDSASVDRVNPSKGYVPGNVLVVSLKANRIKTNATPKEIARVATFYGQYR